MGRYKSPRRKKLNNGRITFSINADTSLFIERVKKAFCSYTVVVDNVFSSDNPVPSYPCIDDAVFESVKTNQIYKECGL